MREWFWIGMKPITDRGDSPSVLLLERSGGGLWLNSQRAEPADEWGPDDEFVFRLRPPSLKAASFAKVAMEAKPERAGK